MATATDKKVEQARIEQLIEDWAQAIQDKDLDRVMSFYAPEMVAFDVIPPLQCVGTETYAKNWEIGFEMCQDTGVFAQHDLHIAVGSDTAFCHWLNRMSGTSKDGEPFDSYVRWTQCWQKTHGHWLIAHEHVSVPVDMETDKALFDAKP